MTKTYDPSLTMRAVRDQYFQDNGFGADGGYSAKWVDFKLGPIPMPFPNTPGRVRAVRYHDLHHIVTGYTTTTLGEFEISAWEIGAGCKGYVVPWQLNLAGLTAGTVSIPRRTFRAFVRGRRSHSLYGLDYEELLDRTLGDVAAQIGAGEPDEARASDVALFAAAMIAGLVSGLASLAALLVAGPPYFVYGLLTRPARAAAAA